MTEALSNKPRLVFSNPGAANTNFAAYNGLREFEISTTPYNAFTKNVTSDYGYEANMSPNDDLTDAKISAAVAQTETKIARLEGKIDTAVVTSRQ